MKGFAGTVGALAAASAFGAVTVSDTYQKQLVTAATEFVASTTKSTPQAGTGLPSGVPTPTFWFDCSQTNGWEISAAGRVTKIPSLVGDRYLTTDQSVGHFPAYNPSTKKSWTVTGADFVAKADGLADGPAIDFGAQTWGTTSASGLVFDGRYLQDGDTIASNTLNRIGSVVTVLDSSQGGGWFLGGGGTGYMWARGQNTVLTALNDVMWASKLAGSSAAGGFRSSVTRQDGLPTLAERLGLSGGWQILSMVANAADVLEATGVGFADARPSYNSTYLHGGGQKIAEMLVFRELLTDAQCKALESHLRQKWLNGSPRGWDGNARMVDAHVYNGVHRLTMNAPAGETLTVAGMNGGRQNTYTATAEADVSGINVTGAGEVRLNDLSEFGGDVRVKEGAALGFERRAVPAELPPRRLAHFDASDSDSLVTTEEGGVTYVSQWMGDDDSKYGGEPLFLAAATDCARPFLRKDVFGEGKNVIDLGPCGTGGASFNFAINAASPVKKTQSGVATIIAVLGAQEGGGHIADQSFARPVSDSAPLYSSALVSSSKQGPYYYLTSGSFFVDGEKIDQSKGYPHPGYMVVAIQVPAFNVSCIGRNGATGAYPGGLRLGELVVYNRTLTEEEIRDASAFLMKKWMGRVPAGYFDADGKAPDVNVLEMNAANGAIDVPAGSTVRIGEPQITQTVEKRGGGTLVIPGVRDTGDAFVVKGGAVVSGHAAEPSGQSEMAPEPAFHLDATDTNRMDLVLEDGTLKVVRWYDERCRNFAFQDEATQRPVLRTGDRYSLNGHPVIDFGAPSTTGAFMPFCKPMSAIRSVYWVWGSQEGGGSLLGASKKCLGMDADTAYQTYDFARGGDSGGVNEKLLIANSATPHTGNGDIYTNGVKVTSSVKASGGYQLVEVHTLGAAHASALACDRDGQLTRVKGGQRLGEVLIYNRVLSPRERVATRNYLRRKWFPDEPLEALPDDKSLALADTTNGVQFVSAVVADEAVSVSGEKTLVAKTLSGAADVVKTGTGTLTVGDLSGYSGTIDVTDGTLALTGSDPVGAATVVESGRIFHADATVGVETTINSHGVVEVTKWTSRHDPNWTAEPYFEGHNPTLRGYGAADSGLQVVDMAASARQCLVFKHNGEQAHVNPIRTVFWVIGSQYGGGRLLGGGTNTNNSAQRYNFHRGYLGDGNSDIARYDPNGRLINNSCDKTIWERSKWRMNGQPISASKTGLSGDWDQVTMTFSGENYYTDAEGFAFDGRSLGANPPSYCETAIGGQRLAEVIIYDRVLSAAEIEQNEAYLRTKWSIGLHKSATNGAKISLAAGATLDLGGTNQFVAALSGAGQVRNGTLSTGRLVADAAATSWTDLQGAFAVPENLVVEVKNLPSEITRLDIRILHAASYAGLANLVNATLVGEPIPEGMKARLRVASDGYLTLRVKRIEGLTVIMK